MTSRKRNFFTAAGSLVLAAGIALQHFVHGGYADFGGGFLIGMSLAFLMLGLVRPSRGIST